MVFVVVIGGGIIGMSSAVAIQRALPGVEVHMVTSKVSPDTTGDGAAGLWGPFLLGDTPPQKIVSWAKDSHDFFQSLWTSGSNAGIIQTNGKIFFLEEHQRDIWADIPLHYELLTETMCKIHGDQYKSGISMNTFIAQSSKLLPFLKKEFTDNGGTVIQQKVSSLAEALEVFGRKRSEELEEAVIVNCTGLGARELVSDHDVYPVRGQIIKVRAPWVTSFIGCDSESDFSYIIPNDDYIVLGGTQQEGNWNLEVDEADRTGIWNRCLKLIPSLKDATVLQDWVGLRPARGKGVRLEEDVINVDSHPVTVVHNYGHGGCGVTLSWGCALDVSRKVKAIAARKERRQTSKL